MRVGLITTWKEKCGLAAYSGNIVKNLPEINWRIIGREEWGDNFSNVPNIARECDLVHIMHQGGLMASMSPEIVSACDKTVVTKQCTGMEHVFNAATVKTSHIKEDGYHFIPHGIPVVDREVLMSDAVARPLHIGCAGIPFNGKGHWEAIQIAELANTGVILVMPENPHTSLDLAYHITEYCRKNEIPYWIETDWLPEEDVARILSWASVNVFYYTRPANGISGAVRMGLAARRPTIVSNHSQFQDIIETGYVNVANSLEEAANMVRNWQDLIYPDPLVNMWSYRNTALMYYKLYQEVVGVC